MSNEDSKPAEQNGPADDAAGSPLTKKLDAAIGSWAEATTAGNAEAADAVAMEVLALAAEWATQNPTPSLLLKNKADLLESKGEWREAEAVRREVLALEESSGSFGLVAKAQMDLGSLLFQIGRREEAWQWASAATESARRFKVVPVVTRALLNEARCALAMDDTGKALAAAEEALRMIGPGKMQESSRARALTTRAKCLLARGDAAGAEADLASAWDLLPTSSGSFVMPGPNWTLAYWWEVKGRLEQTNGNDFRAREAITLAIECHRRVDGPYGLLALARALDRLAEVCRTAGDPAAAEEALEEARSIRAGLRIPGNK